MIPLSTVHPLCRHLVYSIQVLQQAERIVCQLMEPEPDAGRLTDRSTIQFSHARCNRRKGRCMKSRIRIILLLIAVFILAAGAVVAEEEGSDWEQEYDKYIRECREYLALEDGALVLREGIVTFGSYEGMRKENGFEKDPEVTALFRDYPGFLLSGDVMEDELPGFEGRYFTTVKWPSTFRMMGMQSFHALSFGLLSLPSSLEWISEDAFIYCSFDTLRIECELPFADIWNAMYDCSICAYEVSEGNPLYKAVDGVLYSADGKTLIAYPNARKDSHFDVPAGVEHIGAFAFDNENLKTISLPIGLKTIGNYAFADCTRLQDIAVPLTVTSVGEGFLYDCISLERVSLPEGLEADKDGRCTYYTDDSIYRGDNGDTYDSGIINKKSSESQHIYAHFCWIKGDKNLPVYNSREGNKINSVISGGSPVIAQDAFLDRTLVMDPLTREEIGWVDTEKLDIFIQDELFLLLGKPKDGVFPEGETPADDWEWWDAEGPWITTYGIVNIPQEDAQLYRYTEGKYGNDELGVVTDRDILKRLVLLDAPDGNETAVVHVGTQVRILEKRDEWTLVTTGYDEGWIRKEQIRIVPEIENVEEIYR